MEIPSDFIHRNNEKNTAQQDRKVNLLFIQLEVFFVAQLSIVRFRHLEENSELVLTFNLKTSQNEGRIQFP